MFHILSCYKHTLQRFHNGILYYVCGRNRIYLVFYPNRAGGDKQGLEWSQYSFSLEPVQHTNLNKAMQTILSELHIDPQAWKVLVLYEIW
jgi:hypothetical protein